MGKHDEPGETIENRVYLFESLARAFLEQSAGDLGGKSPERRARALRALADLAYVSCAVADTEHLSPKAVRKKVLSAVALAPHAREASAEDDDDAGG